MYLIAHFLDRWEKSSWFKVLGVGFAVFFVGCLCIILDSYYIGLVLMGFLIIPGVMCSIICVSYPGYYTDIGIRGKIVSITVIAVFGFVAIAAAAILLFPAAGFKAGVIVYGIGSLILLPFALRSGKSLQIQFISQPHSIIRHNNPHFAEVKKYYIVLFLYKICLGMLFYVFLIAATSPSHIISLPGIFATICVVAVLVAPFLGHLTDLKGRKLMFNLACALLALLFGLLALSNQGSFGSEDPVIFYVGGILIGVSYPAMLGSEYLIFQELSSDSTRLQTFAHGMFIHVLGIAIGVTIGLLTQTPDIAYYLLVTNLLLIGLFITSTAIEPLPNKEELSWRDALQQVYIYYTISGVGLYEYSFRPGEERADENLVTGGLTGISSLIAEMTKRDGNLTAIRQQNANILFHTGRWVTVALLAENDLKILHSKIETITNEFEEFFEPYLVNFSGNVEVFAPTETLLRRVFKAQSFSS
jgi:MFS family permease